MSGEVEYVRSVAKLFSLCNGLGISVLRIVEAQSQVAWSTLFGVASGLELFKVFVEGPHMGGRSVVQPNSTTPWIESTFTV